MCFQYPTPGPAWANETSAPKAVVVSNRRILLDIVFIIFFVLTRDWSIRFFTLLPVEHRSPAKPFRFVLTLRRNSKLGPTVLFGKKVGASMPSFRMRRTGTNACIIFLAEPDRHRGAFHTVFCLVVGDESDG
jgi:hypothetical protein